MCSYPPTRSVINVSKRCAVECVQHTMQRFFGYLLGHVPHVITIKTSEPSTLSKRPQNTTRSPILSRSPRLIRSAEFSLWSAGRIRDEDRLRDGYFLITI